MDKTELIKKTSKNIGVDEDTVRTVLNGIVDTIFSTLLFGINVKIRDFMSFTLERKEGGPRLNPKTKEEYILPTRYSVKVSLAVPFKNKIKNKTVY